MRDDHHFPQRHTASPSGSRKERLHDDGFQYSGQLSPDLLLLPGLEDINHAVDGLGTVG